jgi:hypothetical protein
MKKLLLIPLMLLVGFASFKTVGAVTKNFSDVPTDAWFYDAVMNMVEWDVIRGHDDGTFKPADNVNRAELSVMWNRYENHVNENIDVQTIFSNYIDMVLFMTNAATYYASVDNSNFLCNIPESSFSIVKSLREDSNDIYNNMRFAETRDKAFSIIVDMNEDISEFIGLFPNCNLQ